MRSTSARPSWTTSVSTGSTNANPGPSCSLLVTPADYVHLAEEGAGTRPIEHERGPQPEHQGHDGTQRDRDRGERTGHADGRTVRRRVAEVHQHDHPQEIGRASCRERV